MAAPFPTREDFFNVGAREFYARQQDRPVGRRVTWAAINTTGTNANALLAAGAAMADEVMRHGAVRFGELFLDSSEDQALDRVIADHIDPELTRKQPAPSVVDLTLTRSSAGAETAFPAGTAIRTQTGVEFLTKEEVILPAGSNGPLSVLAECTTAGLVGNVDERTIVQFAQQPADTTVTVWNFEAATGGSDVESGRDYLARAKLARKSRSKGSLEALQLAALSVPGVKSAVVANALDANGDATGYVWVIVADVAGRANAALLRAVKTALRGVGACGINPRVLGAIPALQAVTYSFAVLDGFEQTAIRAQLKTLTTAMVGQLQPQEPLRRSMLLAIARSVPGIVVTEAGLTAPAADVDPGTTGIVRTNSSLVTFNGA